VEKAAGRRTNVGRKAEATDQFRPPRCGLCVMKLCAPGPSSASTSRQTLPDGVSPNTEGGQTADGRWNRPTNFRHLIGDLLGMRNLRRSWHLAPGADPMGCGTAAHIARSPGELPSRSPKMERRRSEGGTATVGRWNPPKDFGPLIGDLLDMRNSAPMRRPQPSGAIGGRLWPPPHEGTVALEEMGS